MKRKILSICLLSILLLVAFSIPSNGAMQIVPGATTQTNITASEAYAYCYNLRAVTSTLGYNTLDPHLTTNADWGAVAYLAGSMYGCNMNAEQLGAFKTSGNNSGVMDFGKTSYTYTSSISNNADSQGVITNLFNNKETKYVDVLSNQYQPGCAFGETNGWGSQNHWRLAFNSPVAVRIGVFGYYEGYSTSYNSGGAMTDITFRPVIWN